MERDSSIQFTQDLHAESQPLEREQIGFLGIQGKTYPIYDGPNKIGREPDTCSIVLDNGTLSRQHAVINILTTNGERTMMLMDIGSRNKTRVGVKVLKQFLPYPLSDGDSVQFGELYGVFRVLQPKCDMPMTQDFAMTQDMSCTQEVPESPQVVNMKNNIRSNVIVPESPDVSDKDDSLIFKSPMLISKNKLNMKSMPAKMLSKKLSDVAISNNFLNNTTKSMICDETSVKTTVRLSDASNKSHETIDSNFSKNDSSNNTADRSVDESIKSCDSNATIDNKASKNIIGEASERSIDSIFQANTQLPSANSPSIHSLDTQIPLDINRSNEIDIKEEKEAFEDSLLDENDDIHIASTQIILKDTLKKFNNNVSNINEADTQIFNNSDSNINGLQTQVFGSDTKTKDLSHLDTQVFGVNDVSSAKTQVFGENNLCEVDTQVIPKNSQVETKTDNNDQKSILNNTETQIDSRDDDDFCNLNTQMLVEDIAPTNAEEEIEASQKNKNVGIKKPALIDSPDVIEDDEAKEDLYELNTQILKMDEQLTPDFVVPDTTEIPVENTIIKEPEVTKDDSIDKKSVQDKDFLESDEEIAFEGFKENDEDNFDISLSQNIFGDSKAVFEPAPTTKDKTFKSPLQPITPRKRKLEAKKAEEEVAKDMDIADMCTQIVQQRSKSPAAFEDDEILTQCDITFEDMPTQVLTYKKCLEESKRRVSEASQQSVASLSKKSSGNTSGELDNSLNFVSPRKIIAMDLPDSQEIILNINESSDVEDTMLSDSEQEPNTLENTPILYKSKPKNVKKERKNDVKKSLDFTNVAIPVRVMTRVRKPTALLIDADLQSKKAVESILKPKVSDEVDKDILIENITRLKTKKNESNDSALDVNKSSETDVKPKREYAKRNSKKDSIKNGNDVRTKEKAEKTGKKEAAKKENSKTKRKSSESGTSKDESYVARPNSRASKRKSNETKSDETKTVIKPADTKEKSDSQTAKNTDNQRITRSESQTNKRSDSQNTDKHTSKDTRSTKRRTNSVSSDKTEPKRKRTRLDQKKEDEAIKVLDKESSRSKSRNKTSEEAKIDLTNDKANIKITTKTENKSERIAIEKESKPSKTTTRKSDDSKTDLTNGIKDSKTDTKAKETEKISGRIAKKAKDSTKTSKEEINQLKKPDLVDLTDQNTKTNSQTTNKDRKIKGILKNVNQIDKYFVKEPSPHRIELRKRQIDVENIDVKKRRVDSQKTSKKQKDKEVLTYKVLFTAFHNEEVKKKLVELGAILVTEIKECDVLVTVQIKRTFKLLCAVGLGKPIVGPQWVQKCVDTGTMVDPWQYVIQDETSETKFKFNLKNTLKGKRNFLRGYKVSSTPSVNPKEDEMKQIVECSGGKWGTGGRKWLCVTSMLDKHAWPSLETKGATLIHVEFMLHGALTQSFNLDSYKLTAK